MIATAVLAAEYAGTLELLDTTTVRARATQQLSSDQQPQAQPVQGGLDLSTIPSATATLSDRRSAYALSYSASFTLPDLITFLPDLGASLDLEIFQFGSVVAAWHDRWTTFTLTEAASYGQINSAYIATLPAPPGQPPPTPTTAPAPSTLTLGSSFTDATLGQRLGRRSLLSLSATYIVDGGADTNSRLYLPEEYGPRVSASLAYDLSRRDTLTTQAIAQEISTTGGCPPPSAPAPAVAPTSPRQPTPPLPPTTLGICHERVEDVQVDETLRRRLWPTTTLSLGGGMALYDVDAPGVVDTVLYPVVLAALSYAYGARGTSDFVVSAELGPVVDVRTGIASERIEARAEVTDRTSSAVTLRTSVNGLRSVGGNDPYPVSYLFTGSADAIFHLNRQVDFTVGAEALLQDQKVYGTLWSAFAYAALTLRGPPTRF